MAERSSRLILPYLLELPQIKCGDLVEDFTKAIEDAVRQENWLAAISLSLLMPDICGSIDEPSNKSSRDRYARWFDTWFQFKESNQVLAGNDCYALRCALIHEGRDVTNSQKAKKEIDKFHFVKPPTDGSTPYVTEIGGGFYIPVDMFASEMCAALSRWLSSKSKDVDAQERMGNLIKIHQPTEHIAGGKLTYPSFGMTGTISAG